jgi:hypothetical protein
LEPDPTVEGRELTPSLKVKRPAVAEQNRELLDSFYTERRLRDNPSAGNGDIDRQGLTDGIGHGPVVMLHRACQFVDQWALGT